MATIEEILAAMKEHKDDFMATFKSKFAAMKEESALRVGRRAHGLRSGGDLGDERPTGRQTQGPEGFGCGERPPRKMKVHLSSLRFDHLRCLLSCFILTTAATADIRDPIRRLTAHARRPSGVAQSKLMTDARVINASLLALRGCP